MCPQTTKKILQESSIAGVTVLQRPEKLALDKTSSVAAAIFELGRIPEFSRVCLVQCTNPFLSSSTILEALRFADEKRCAVFSAKSFSVGLWLWNNTEPFFPLLQGVQAQALPPAFLPAGGFFIQSVADLKEHKSFFKPAAIPYKISDIESIDIDTLQDLEFARWQAQQLQAAI